MDPLREAAWLYDHKAPPPRVGLHGGSRHGARASPRSRSTSKSAQICSVPRETCPRSPIAPDDPAVADDTVDSSETEPSVEEIVVMGTATPGHGATVPTSVIGFDTSELATLGVVDVGDIAAITPSLEIKTRSGTTPTFFIRGVGLNDFGANATGAVAIYKDGAPINAPALRLGLRICAFEPGLHAVGALGRCAPRPRPGLRAREARPSGPGIPAGRRSPPTRRSVSSERDVHSGRHSPTTGPTTSPTAGSSTSTARRRQGPRSSRAEDRIRGDVHRAPRPRRRRTRPSPAGRS